MRDIDITVKRYTYKGKRIVKDRVAYRVYGYTWGDQPGEDVHSFKTLTAAQQFIDRMEMNR